MKRAATSAGSWMILGSLALLGAGCARPFEIGYDVGYSTGERHNQIARNWDLEGKQLVEDVDHALLLRPVGTLTYWNPR